MIRVVIISDQIKNEKVRELADWQAYDMEVVCTSCDVSKTFKLVQTYAADLLIYNVLSDESKNLEIVEDCKNENENLNVIIISGLKDFDYFKRAFRCGISDFLNVPLNNSELSFSLRNIREKYVKKIELFFENQNAQNSDGMRSKFFSELLSQKIPSGGLTIDSVNKEYCFKFDSGCFQAFIIKLDWPYDSYDLTVINSFIQKLLITLSKSLHFLCFDVKFYAQGSRIYAILNYKKTNYPDIKNQLTVLIEEFHRYDGIIDKSITIGLGSSETNISSLMYSLFEAETSVAQRIIVGTDKIIENIIKMPNNLLSNIILTNFYKTGFFVEDNLLGANPVPVLDNFLEKAKIILDVLQKDRLISLLVNFEKDILNIPLKGIEFISVMQRTCRDCINFLCSHNLCLYELEQHYFTYNQKADLCKNKNELTKLFSKTLLTAFETVFNNFEQMETKPVRLAKQYINQNFCTTLSLELIADYVGFNSAYFSTLFKKESGQSFSDYVLEVRMIKAQEMLKKTNLKIDTICGKVGYMDVKHFTQNFKKFTGLNPSEYRKSFS